MNQALLAIGVTVPLVASYLILESRSQEMLFVALPQSAQERRIERPQQNEAVRIDTPSPSRGEEDFLQQDPAVVLVPISEPQPVVVAPGAPHFFPPDDEPDDDDDDYEEDEEEDDEPADPVLPPLADIASRWRSRPNGPYTLAQAIEDFKSPVNGWESSRMHIQNGRLRTTLLKNTVGPDGGLVSRIDVEDSDEYELSFDFMFDDNFDFSQGGKVGFGLLIGEGYTGGVPATGGDGASVRLMWYQNTSASPVILRPYVYHKDQPGQFGDDFGKVFPASGSLEKGTWYRVAMYVKSNTGSNMDGRARITINGSVLLDQAIRYTTNDAKRLVNRVTFETFRGGADASWQSSIDGYIYFDNVRWKAL